MGRLQFVTNLTLLSESIRMSGQLELPNNRLFTLMSLDRKRTGVEIFQL